MNTILSKKKKARNTNQKWNKSDLKIKQKKLMKNNTQNNQKENMNKN